MPSYGIGFQPGQDQNGQGSGPAPLESVVKLLSLRLPSVVGAQGIAPQGLLNAPGMAGQGGGMGETQWLQMLRQLLSGGGMGMGAQGMGMPGGTAGPRIIPGIDDPSGTPGPGGLGQVDWASVLRGRTGGNTGIGDTGRGNPGPLGPAAPATPPQMPRGPMDGLLER
jgi:hypothetical protein